MLDSVISPRRRDLSRALIGTLVLLLAFLTSGTWVYLASAAMDRENAMSAARLILWQRTLNATVNGETGQRGYVITGRDSYLAPWNTARQEMEAADAALLKAYVDDPGELHEIEALRDIQRAKFDEMQSTLDVRARLGRDAAEAIVMNDSGSRLMGRIRQDCQDGLHKEQERAAALALRTGHLRTGVLVAQVAIVLLAILTSVVALQSSKRHEAWRLDAVRALSRSERALRLITENLPVVISRIDPDYRYTFANARYEEWFGFAPASMVGRSVAEVFGKEVFASVQPNMARALAGDPVAFDLPSRFARGPRTMQVHYVPDLNEHGSVVGIFGLVLDRTEQAVAAAQLEASEHMLRAVTDNLPVLITYVDREQNLRFLNDTFHRWMGTDTGRTVGRSLRDTIGDELYEQCRPAVERALGGERVEFEVTSNALGVRRELHTVYVPDVSDDGQVAGIFTLATDVTEFKRVQAELRHLTRVDALTGLPNRRAFEQRLDEALSRARRDGRPMALLFLDIDKFKGINDSLGHAAGDGVLCAVGARLQSMIRTTDLAARLAGDEFVVILEGLWHPDEATAVAAKIVEEIRRPMPVDGLTLQVTTSLGVACSDGTHPDGPRLLADADRALYDAKANGRDGFALAAVEAPTVNTAATPA